MKKLFIIALAVPLFLLSCGKTEEVKTVVNPLVMEKQAVVAPSIMESPVVVDGSVIESGIGSNSGNLMVDTSKEFNIDDYLKRGTYTILRKESKGDIIVYIAHISTTDKENSCFDDTPCVSFITKGGVLTFTNLKNPGDITYDNIEGPEGIRTQDFYKFHPYGVELIADGGGSGMECASSKWEMYSYISLSTKKKIYEERTESRSCEKFKSGSDWEKEGCDKACEKWKNGVNSTFYKSDDITQKINLKATNIEDAYFEYYKESR